MRTASSPLILLSLPGLRREDVDRMPNLSQLASAGQVAELTPSFPCVTWPVQTNMLTGKPPAVHGVVANGFYWRDERRVEMWTASNDISMSPWLWDTARSRDRRITSAIWFPMLAKGATADFACMPAPVHNPDGSESLWCYSRPGELYGELLAKFGHFPLMNFWGPMAGIASSRWIAQTAVHVGTRFRPDFFYIYLPHLDYAAQKSGPDSPAAIAALSELDDVLMGLIAGMRAAYATEPRWLVASEYVITAVEHVLYPNRILREAGLLAVEPREDGEHLDFTGSSAWALVDHQFSHIFLREPGGAMERRVADLFRSQKGVAEVLDREAQVAKGMGHARGGDLVLVSTRDSWQAYYWWLDDTVAPGFARTVDIHRKPGYDPVELHFDPVRRQIPLDATLVGGSHGAPAHDVDQRGVLLSSVSLAGLRDSMRDVELHDLVLNALTT